MLRHGDFYIIGGAIRAVYYDTSPRDIDIIVKQNAEALLEEFAGQMLVTKYYFGGFKLDLNGITIDLWDFPNHWAFKNNLLEATESNLSESCLFDFDALVYSPKNGFLDIDRFKRSLESRTIDFVRHDNEYINDNPGKLNNVLRALVAANDFNLGFSESVARYIKNHVAELEYSTLKECEMRHYKEERISSAQFLKVKQALI